MKLKKNVYVYMEFPHTNGSFLFLSCPFTPGTKASPRLFTCSAEKPGFLSPLYLPPSLSPLSPSPRPPWERRRAIKNIPETAGLHFYFTSHSLFMIIHFFSPLFFLARPLLCLFVCCNRLNFSRSFIDFCVFVCND